MLWADALTAPLVIPKTKNKPNDINSICSFAIRTSSLNDQCPYILGSRGGSNTFFLIIIISVLVIDFFTIQAIIGAL